MRNIRRFAFALAMTGGLSLAHANAQPASLLSRRLDPPPPPPAPGESTQVKDPLFAGTEKFAKNASEVNEINLDPAMLGAVSGSSSKANVAHKLEFLVVHTYEYAKAGMYNPSDVEVYRSRLTDSDWNCFIHERTKEESTDICKRNSADGDTTEMVILTMEPKELTFIHMKGHGVSLADLEKLNGIAGPVPPAPPPPPPAPAAPKK